MKKDKTGVLRKHSRTAFAASLTLGAVVAAARPVIPEKAFALPNVYDWEKQGDLDRIGGNFTSSAISANGNHMIVGVEWGGEGQDQASPLYITDNAGASWTDVKDEVEDGIRNNWSSVDVSNNGQTMVAASESRKVINADELEGKIFKSVDAGDNWDDITPSTEGDNNGWESVVVSGNGQTMVAVSNDDNDSVYISSNAGEDWTASDVGAVDDWNSISVSDNGNKILVGGEAADDSAFVYFSDDGGDTWDNIAPFELYDTSFTIETDISADGSKIAVASFGYEEDSITAVSISENDGDSWSDITPDIDGDLSWEDIAMSDDGSVIAVINNNNTMFITSDDGENWNEEDPGAEAEETNGWRAIDLNSDGTQAIATSADNTYIGSGEFGTDSTVSLTNAENGKAIQIITPDGTTITCHEAMKESELSAKDAGYQYPLGLVDFCFDTPNESNEVTLIFVTDLKPNEVVARKYNTTSETYSDVPGASITETTLDGKHALQLTYTIVDNGPLDLDPDEGEIADPVGLASALEAPNTGLQRFWLLDIKKD